MKKVLILTAVLIAFSFSFASAAQMNGMVSGNGLPTLPTTLVTYVNPSGLGDALIYPYFNVRDNKVTYFNVVNTDTEDDSGVIGGFDQGALVKIRFREAATIEDGCGAGVDCGSLEVLDFIICLSKGDVWTGAIVSDSDGAGRLFSLDTDTLTYPSIPAAGVQFKFGANNPASGITADNTREGYFEILSAGTLVDEPATCDASTVATGEPFDMLMGFGFIHDEDTNATYAYNATAIAQCRSAAFAPTLTNENFNLSDCQDSGLVAGLDNADYPLTKYSLLGSYLVQEDLGARTAMVITFPTKKLNTTTPDDTLLFSNPIVSLDVWDDQENRITPQSDFSPVVTVTSTLPHEVNVLNIKETAMFTSDVSGVVDISGLAPNEYGWMRVTLAEAILAPTYTPAAANDISDTMYPHAAGPWVSYGFPTIALMFSDAIDEAISWALPTAFTTVISDDNGTTATISPY